MPGCGLPGRPWTSPRGLPYFRHQPDADRACTSHPPESPEHLEAKLAVADAAEAAGWQALVEEPGPGWEADVLAVKDGVRLALEVQWSPQTLDRYRERQAAYRAAGVHGVWFARQPPAAEPCRDLPVFALARGESDGAPALHTVTVQGRPLALHVAVGGLLHGDIRFCSRIAKRGEKPRRVVSAYANDCWKCSKEMTVWNVEDGGVEGMCGLLAETYGQWSLWETSRPEAAPDVQRVMAALTDDAGLPALARLKHRRTGPVPQGYMAFCCPHCGIVQGDFDLRNMLMSRSYDPPDGTTMLVSDGPDAVADMPHWCHGGPGGHCPR